MTTESCSDKIHPKLPLLGHKEEPLVRELSLTSMAQIRDPFTANKTTRRTR